MGKGSCLLCLIFFCVAYVEAVDMCNMLESCGACIQSNLQCNWCSGYSLNSTSPRCFKATNDTCPDIVNPQGSTTLLEDEDFGELLQIKPQRASIKLRVGAPQTLDFTVRPSRGYPLDLYFLIDYSGSLVDFIDTLKNVTQELATTLGNVSDNYRVGLGIFVDKPVKPFMSTHPDTKVQPFSFIHVLNFTGNASKLIDALSERNATENLDNPEGLMDGLMQVAVCQDVIRWRMGARRLIFSLTDAAFKTAGHGKYAGILTPNDGRCHLENNEYTAATEYDYASMGHLAKVFANNEIIPLLGVPQTFQSNIQNYHQSLTEAIEGGSVTIISSDDLVQKIDEKYKELSAEVRARAEIESNIDGLSVDISLKECSATRRGDVCSNTAFEDKVNFTATFTASMCSDELRQGTEVIIRSVFFGAISVDVSVICECPCEEEKPTTNSEQCSNKGKLVCGMCECDPSSYGTVCECDFSGNGTGTTECPKSEDGLECSGQGTCNCGVCECNTGYYGTKCECNDASCPIAERDTFTMCNGQTCQCGVCQCGDAYSGDACECSTATNRCIENGTSTLCSGQGQCQCNECECDRGYGGSFCEICVEGDICEIPVDCPTLSACVSCSTNINEQLTVVKSNADCSSVCDTNTRIELINAPASSTSLSLNGTLGSECTIVGGGNCNSIRFFVFRFNINSTVIQVVNNPTNCVAPPEAWIIAVPIVIGLLLLGIILLIAIKLFLVLMDHLEYRKFVKDVKDNTVGNMINPLYTAPQQQIDNPLYRGEN